MPLTSVPGQSPAGIIDGFLRADPGDGTLGNPDFSPVPYTYTPLLGPVDGPLSWTVDRFRGSTYAGFKGNPDGQGFVRDTLSTTSSYLLQIMASPPTRAASGSTSRTPDSMWGPGDVAFAVRHPGDTSWEPGDVRAYVAVSYAQQKIGMRLTAPGALGPWDADWADSAAIPLSSLGSPNLWDGAPHEFIISTFGSNVLVTIDSVRTATFRAPRAYQRNANGTVNTAVFADLPAAGTFGGFDTRDEQNLAYSWYALPPASGDFFRYDQGATAVQTPPAGTYNPLGTALPSGETWSGSGTVAASKDGISLNASSSARFDVVHPYGYIRTIWGTAQPNAGVLFRRQDANHFYVITTTGYQRYTAGSPVSNAFTHAGGPLAPGDRVDILNYANEFRVYRNGTQTLLINNLVQGQGGTGVGFFNPAGSPGAASFRYIATQPFLTSPRLPTV